VRKLTYFIAVSVDGFIAGPGGEVDMYPTPESYLAHLTSEYPDTLPTRARAGLGIGDVPNKAFDTIVMGRATYDPALAAGISSPYSHLRQLVVSTTLAAADHPDVEIVAGDPVARVRELKAESGLGIYLAGGARLAGALYGEIDELIVKMYPIVLGTGIPMLSGAFDPASLRRADVTSFDSGHLILRYTRT
jgi:dihydrofolate reductase